MSIFLVAVLFLLGLVVFFFLLGKLTPGNGADLVDWDPAKMAEKKLERQMIDQDEMLALANRKRRERGLPDLSKRGLDDEDPLL